jgi:hypothetical protein
MSVGSAPRPLRSVEPPSSTNSVLLGEEPRHVSSRAAPSPRGRRADLAESQHDVEPRVVLGDAIGQHEQVGRDGKRWHGAGMVAKEQ